MGRVGWQAIIIVFCLTFYTFILFLLEQCCFYCMFFEIMLLFMIMLIFFICYLYFLPSSPVENPHFHCICTNTIIGHVNKYVTREVKLPELFQSQQQLHAENLKKYWVMHWHFDFDFVCLHVFSYFTVHKLLFAVSCFKCKGQSRKVEKKLCKHYLKIQN